MLYVTGCLEEAGIILVRTAFDEDVAETLIIFIPSNQSFIFTLIVAHAAQKGNDVDGYEPEYQPFSGISSFFCVPNMDIPPLLLFLWSANLLRL